VRSRTLGLLLVVVGVIIIVVVILWLVGVIRL